MLSKEVNF